VKCDEGKPFCTRCLKWGADCEGYDVQARRSSSARTGFQEIIPKTGRQQTFISHPVENPPSTVAFRDNREYLYFLYFQEEAAPNISDLFDKDLWRYVIPQASWKDPALSGLTVSLGALYKAKSLNSDKLSKEEINIHQQYAFQQFGRSLRLIQARISTNKYEDITRVALIASLLIYCFESVHGEPEPALGHLESAFRLMRKELTCANRRYEHSKNVSPSLILDDELVAAFFRLDIVVSSRDQICKARKFSSRLGINYLEDLCQVPRRFSSISEARNYLEHIQFVSGPSLSHFLLSMSSAPPAPITINEGFRNMYRSTLTQLRRWNIAFKEYYPGTREQSENKNFAAAATLRVRALSTELATKRVCARELSSCYFYNPECQEIVDLSRLLASEPSFRKPLVWDCGIIPGLATVIIVCLEMNLRKEALQILKQIAPRREGAWDSSTAVQFGESCWQMNGAS